jgi:7,8-dihydro-6-hydroxymethylpterin-pyrophosphokinase
MASPHWFTNAVGRLQVSLSPLELLEVLMAVEKRFGRERGGQHFGYQDRSLDLDLLQYGRVELDMPELILPHPRIDDRLFVLLPFAELAPGLTDGNGQTLEQRTLALKRRIAIGEVKPQEIAAENWDAVLT